MKTLTINLPWTLLCSENRRYVSQFNKALSPEYRAAKYGAALVATAAAKKAKWVVPTGPLRMDVTFTEPDHRKRDYKNFSKALCDSLTASGHVWIDDSQIRCGYEESVKVSKDHAGAVIVITTLKGEG